MKRRKQRKNQKSSEATLTHNGVYRLDELAAAFGVPKSIMYQWAIQDKLVQPDYLGRARRPSLYLEKTAATIYIAKSLMEANVTKANIKRLFKANEQMFTSDSPSVNDVAHLDLGVVKMTVKVGMARQMAKEALRQYVAGAAASERFERVRKILKEAKNTKGDGDGVQKESGSEAGALQTHNGVPVGAA